MAATTKTWLNSNPPQLDDVDLNGFKNENNNLIVGAGMALSDADNQQTHKAVAAYAAGGDYYTESGVVDAYVLATVGAKVAPPAYFNGMKIRFTAGNTNTGPATVNVSGLGVKSLVRDDTGGALNAGDIRDSRETRAYYDGTVFRVTLSISAASSFEARPAGTPNMTVVIGAGIIQNAETLTNVAEQTTSVITAPSGNPRIDRIVIDDTTGVYSIVTGVEAASPVAPAIPVRKIAICQILLDDSPATTAITSDLITDERGLVTTGPSLVPIESKVLSSDLTAEFVAGINSDYEEYVLRFSKVLAGTGNVDFLFAVSEDTGTTWEDDGVVSTYKQGTGTVNEAKIGNLVNNSLSGGLSGEIRIFKPSGAGKVLIMSSIVSDHTVGGVTREDQVHLWQGSSAVDGFRVKYGVGSMTTGSITLYGVRY